MSLAASEQKRDIFHTKEALWHDARQYPFPATGVPAARQFPAALPLTAHFHGEEFGDRLFNNSRTSLSLAKNRKLCFIESSL